MKYRVKEMYKRGPDAEEKESGRQFKPHVQIETLKIVDDNYRSLQALQGGSVTDRGGASTLIARRGNDSTISQHQRSPLELLRAYASTGQKLFARLQKSSSEAKLHDDRQLPEISKFSRNERLAVPKNLLRSVTYAELEGK